MKPSRTILIVDDSETDQHAYRRVFKDRTEYGWLSAHSAEAGLAAVAEAKPNLILLDYNLPDMDGLSFMARLAETSSITIPVIMLTGEGNESLAVETMKSGAIDYLVKHVDGRHLKLLPTVIEHAIQKHEALEAKDIAEKALAESALRLKEMFENLRSGVAVYSVSPDGQDFFFTAFNIAAERIENAHREALMGKNIIDVFPEVAEFGLIEVFRRVWKTGVAEHFPVAYSRDGHVTSWRENYIFKLHSGELVTIYDDVTKEKQVEEKMFHLAHHDQLTGLPNRSLFFDRLANEIAKARRTGKYVALLFLDLDGFKPVNDEYGHAAGDVVLKTVAGRLQACVREIDTVVRMGGDEFTVILGEIDASSEVAAVAEKLIKSLSPEMLLPDGHKCRVGTSIGVALYPINATEMDTLLVQADAAMYESKMRGKNTFTFSSKKSVVNEGTGKWLVFNAAQSIGVETIDEVHRELIRKINHLNDAINKRYGQAETHGLVKVLTNFAMSHFGTEHRYMTEYEYPDKSRHELEHEQLTNELASLAANFGQGKEILGLHKFKDMQVNHMLNADKKLGEYLVAKGVV